MNPKPTAGGAIGGAPRRSSAARLARARAGAQGLHRPTAHRHPVDVIRETGPVQAQEPRAARLAFRARSRRLVAADVDRARTEERSLLRAWLMRRTAHLVPSEDAGWILPLFEPVITPWSRKRLAELGFDRRAQDRALALFRRWIEADGPLTRPELLARLTEHGFPDPAEGKYHLWTLATLAGGLCLGPDRGGQTCLVPIAEWIGEPRPVPRERGLAELARRYLRAFAPAGERDFARWAGLPLRDARLGLERIATELREVRLGGETLLAPGRRPRMPATPVVRLLGAYDNYNLGYESRAFALAEQHAARVLPGGGIVRPTITVDGRIAAAWSSKRNGKRLAVSIEPFTDLGREWEEAIAAEVADLGRFEGAEAALAPGGG